VLRCLAPAGGLAGTNSSGRMAEEEKVMLRFGRALACFLSVLFVCGLVPLVAQSVNSQKQVERDAIFG
jgi:hypothetical protein